MSRRVACVCCVVLKSGKLERWVGVGVGVGELFMEARSWRGQVQPGVEERGACSRGTGKQGDDSFLGLLLAPIGGTVVGSLL
jgi:hypothetical protein